MQSDRNRRTRLAIDSRVVDHHVGQHHVIQSQVDGRRSGPVNNRRLNHDRIQPQLASGISGKVNHDALTGIRSNFQFSDHNRREFRFLSGS